MPTKAQKEKLLFEIKQINALKVKRNRTKNPANKKVLQNLITIAEKQYISNRIKYGQANLNPLLSLREAVEVIEKNLHYKTTPHNKKMILAAGKKVVLKMRSKK